MCSKGKKNCQKGQKIVKNKSKHFATISLVKNTCQNVTAKQCKKSVKECAGSSGDGHGCLEGGQGSLPRTGHGASGGGATSRVWRGPVADRVQILPGDEGSTPQTERNCE